VKGAEAEVVASGRVLLAAGTEECLCLWLGAGWLPPEGASVSFSDSFDLCSQWVQRLREGPRELGTLREAEVLAAHSSLGWLRTHLHLTWAHHECALGASAELRSASAAQAEGAQMDAPPPPPLPLAADERRSGEESIGSRSQRNSNSFRRYMIMIIMIMMMMMMMRIKTTTNNNNN